MENTTYEAPTITEVGSVRDLTLGQGFIGSADQFVIGSVSIPYGHS